METGVMEFKTWTTKSKYLRTKRFEAQGLCNVCGKRQPKSDKHKKCEECIDKRKLQEARRWQ